ncbi:MAG: serine/threonine-protein kinase [Pseudomonadota bacterium]
MSERRIGSYQVIEEIGQGGMAVVYRGTQEALDRPVAIKELKSEFTHDAQIIERFQREALSVAKLQHENIVHVYDYVCEGDTRSIVMEFVEGVSLYDLLARVDRLPPEVAAAIALQLARALEYAHFRGMVHRDIKPSNVVLSKLGEVKLMDFGIARAEALGDLTRPGIALGTPSYMSPEQIMGERVDWRSDMFSFGIVLYQMLTGRKPFRDTEQRTVMQSILKDSYPSPRTIQPDIPLVLQRIVSRCLRKPLERRYPSTEALRVALERYVSRQIRINLRSRLVAFLHHRGLVSEEDALTVLPRAVLTETSLTEMDLAFSRSRWPGLRRVALIGAAGLLSASLGASVIEWWPQDVGRRGAMAATGNGHLRVNVWPWARVFIDGAYVDTTPFMRALPLAPGRHVVELRNEHFRDERRVVEIEPDRTITFNIELTERREQRP